MFTVLEVKPLKPRLRTQASFSQRLWQSLRRLCLPKHKNCERVMIPTLQSPDKELGVQAAEAIRSQLAKQTNIRDLVVVPRPTSTIAFSPRDTRRPRLWLPVMPRRWRPSFVLRNTSRHRRQDPTGYKIDSRMIISRDMNKAQVLRAPRARSSTMQPVRSRVRSRMRAVSCLPRRPATTTSRKGSIRMRWRRRVKVSSAIQREHSLGLSGRSIQHAQDVGLCHSGW